MREKTHTPLPLTFRPPTVADAPAIIRLVAESGTLDRNSDYFYLLFCIEFAKTCQVALTPEGELAGMMLGLRPPERPDTLFVWQVAVAPAMRRRGLARQLILAALDQPHNRDIAWLEATITPSNGASRALFTNLGSLFSVPVQQEAYITGSLFPDGGHEPEELFRIGPLGPGGTSRNPSPRSHESIRAE